MTFNSYQFLIFFPIVLLVYFIVPRKVRYIWLLLSSYYFYMSWGVSYGIWLGVSTVVTYLSGILLDREKEKQREKYKKIIIALCVIINIGILGVFKYSNFMIENVNILLSGFHMKKWDSFNIMLPVGISFYTFQALSYTIDVYRGKNKAERNFFRYALYVSFFPTIASGPIERCGNLLKQIEKMDTFKLWNLDRISAGCIIMLWGFFQKLVISDRISIFVNNVYSEYWLYGTVELVLATVLFAIQLYCDFGSYSLIAIGAAKIMGFDLIRNFETPYFAQSIKEFWRRWHISLSTWFRDYVYIPLGGSRCSKLKKYRNLLATFLVSGLWHGASWNYIIWGGIHGIYQIAGDLMSPFRNKACQKLKVKTDCMSYKFGRMSITFILTCFAWIFFRMEKLSDAILFIKRIFTRPDFWVLHDGSLYKIGLDQTEVHILFLALLLLVIIDTLQYRKRVSIDEYLKLQNIWFRWGAIFLMLFAIIIYGIYGPTYSATQFIYFQF